MRAPRTDHPHDSYGDDGRSVRAGAVRAAVRSGGLTPGGPAVRPPALRPVRPTDDPHTFIGALRYARRVALHNSLAALAFLKLTARKDRSSARAVLDAAKVSSTVVCLALTAQKLDHWPTQREYAADWEISERKAQLEWELFREAFPGQESPDQAAQWIVLHARPKDRSDAFTAPVPPALAAA